MEIAWVKSAKCESSACAEAALQEDHILFRSSLTPDSNPIKVPLEPWAYFIAFLKEEDPLGLTPLT